MNINQSTDDSFSLTTTLGRGMALARLIDDELTTAQERELLKHLDGHPELWRHCALGFLEERALRRGSRGWVMAQKTNTTSVPLAPPVSTMAERTDALAEPVARNTAPKRRNWLDYATLAAGLLLAFSVGLIVQQYQSRSLPSNMPVAKNQVPEPDSEASPATPLAVNDSLNNLRLQYVSNNGEPSNKEIDVPLIPVNNVDDSMLASSEQATRQNPIPPETQRWLEQEGQVIRQQNLWLTVDLPNGQQALVPVQRIVVQPRHLLAQ